MTESTIVSVSKKILANSFFGSYTAERFDITKLKFDGTLDELLNLYIYLKHILKNVLLSFVLLSLVILMIVIRRKYILTFLSTINTV